MLVCHCHGVNDAAIRATIDAGARDELDVAAACRAGTDCGGCLPTIGRLLDECVTCPLRVEWMAPEDAAVA